MSLPRLFGAAVLFGVWAALVPGPWQPFVLLAALVVVVRSGLRAAS